MEISCRRTEPAFVLALRLFLTKLTFSLAYLKVVFVVLISALLGFVGVAKPRSFFFTWECGPSHRYFLMAFESESIGMVFKFALASDFNVLFISNSTDFYF